MNGYGVIGKRVADAVSVQKDMDLIGVADVVADWRARMAISKGFALYAADPDRAPAMRAGGLDVTGGLDDLLASADIVVDCTPKKSRRAQRRNLPRKRYPVHRSWRRKARSDRPFLRRRSELCKHDWAR